LNVGYKIQLYYAIKKLQSRDESNIKVSLREFERVSESLRESNVHNMHNMLTTILFIVQNIAKYLLFLSLDNSLIEVVKLSYD
jgi:hypothetical protein